MPIKGTGGSSQGEGKKKQTDGRGENRWENKREEREENRGKTKECDRDREK
jgi:hypothetical protein